MATLDLILAIPIVIGAFNGYKKGLLIEIFGIAAFVAAIVIGFKFLSFGSYFIEQFIGKESLASISPYLSFFIIFIPTIFLIRKVGWLLRKAVRLTFLGTLDGLLGAFLGGFMALLGVSIFLWLLSKTGISIPVSYLKDAQYYIYVRDFAPNMLSSLLQKIPGGNWIVYMSDLKDKITN